MQGPHYHMSGLLNQVVDTVRDHFNKPHCPKRHILNIRIKTEPVMVRADATLHILYIL